MNSEKKKVVKFKLKPDFDFVIYAIASTMNDYHISWALNQILNIDLRRADNFEIKDSKNATTKSYALYTFTDEESETYYSLITNKSENGVLLKDFSGFDYFLKVESAESEIEVDEILLKIKSIDDVLMANRITHELLPEKKQSIIFGVFTEL